MNLRAQKAFGGILEALRILRRRDSRVFIVDNLSQIKAKTACLGLIIKGSLYILHV